VLGLVAVNRVDSHVAPLGVVVLGVTFGAVTGLLAVGLVLVYRTTRVVNFAYGAMGGLAATFGIELFLARGVPWPAAIGIAVVSGIAIGVAVERIVIRRFSNSSRLVLTVATIGLAQVLGGAEVLVPLLFGQSSLIPTFSTPLTDVQVEIHPLILTGNDLLVMVVVPVVLAGLSWFLLGTDQGRAVRAIAENAERAQLLGIPIRRLSTLVWAIVGGLAALTVVLKAPGQGLTIDAAAGPAVLLPALAAAVVARMGSLPAAFGAGLALGVFDQIVRWNVSQQAVTSVVFAAVILVGLLWRRRDTSRAEAVDESSWSLTGGARPLPAEVAALPVVRWSRAGLLALAAAVALAVPLVATPSQTNRVSSALVLAMAALSLVVLTGWGGTVSLGQVGIVGVGGVVAANLIAKANLDLFLTLGASALAGALVAVLVGLPAFRVKGIFLAVTTLAFAVAMESYLVNPTNFPGWIPGSYDRPVLWKHLDLSGERPMYYLCLAAVVIVLLIIHTTRSTRTGRVLRATRDNPRAAAAMAVPTLRAQLTGFVLAGAMAGMAGALGATLLRGVGYQTYPVATSILVFSMAVIGGISSMSGTLIGVAFVQALILVVPRLALVFTGAALLVVLYAVPGGIGQALELARNRLVRWLAARRGIALVERFADGSSDAAPLGGHASPGAPPSSRPPAVRPAGDTAMLSARGLTASYGPLQVLFGVDLEVGEGEIVALLGTNGAGKSTVLRAITGLLTSSTGGTVELGGRNLAGVPTERIAAQGLALMPGGRGVFPTLTVAENLRLATWLLRSDPIAAEAAREEMLDLFPLLCDRLGVMAGNLSGGEQQMLSLAMAFVTRPRVLCIDELSLGLAPAVVAQLCDRVRDIHVAGTTIVLVEQSVDVALRLAERAVFLEKGQVRFCGPTAELLDRPELLRSVFIEAGRRRGATAVLAERGRPEPGTGPGMGRRLRRPVVGVGAPNHTAMSRQAKSHEQSLSCRGITRRFGGITALDGVDLDVAPGRIVGLIGHNGAGKTTLFDVVAGFLVPDSGHVVLGGRDVTTDPPHRRAVAGLGRSFQEARLFPSLTVAETVAVALERHLPNRDALAAALALPASTYMEAAVTERVEELLGVLGLTGYGDHRVAELSTGTRRIVELACVLAQEPAVVLLDEPSAGVAQRETEALGPLLRRVQRETGCAMVVIEHDMGLVSSLCDELVALELGSVIARGAPAEVLSHPRVVDSYLGTGDALVHA
jgi:ABC-type branched-subunit amino acid transport system ATPase component/branched-subunit amino acid ABC-type transport system permease component